jgi:sugar/nucleoside kinase (ribokinase family)
MTVPDLVVVGCPSEDRIVVGGRPRDAVGGAAWITALAARVAGASVGLLATVPPRLPGAIARCFGPGGIDRGGLVVVPGELPSFHIVYDGAQEAAYVAARAGVEDALSAADLPQPWLSARLIHVASLGGSTVHQLRFVDDLRERGYVGMVSAGTYPRAVAEEPERVGELLLRSDFFFLNRAEAGQLIPDGPPRRHRGVVCVTAGADGVRVLGGGGSSTDFAAPPTRVVDPTGAGDSFCGGFLGATVRGLDGVAAGLAIAGLTLGGWGSEPLAERVAADVQPRVVADPDRIDRVARVLADQAAGAAFDFCGGAFPGRDEPNALALFAAATLHQYGFWNDDGHRWIGPMYAGIGGHRWKGSDFVWQAFARAVAADPTVLAPGRMAAEPDLIDRICVDDEGICPLPDLESHRALHQAYGAGLLDRGLDWPRTLADVNRRDRPIAGLLALLSELPGYAEDPLAKKANLLAVILAGRPERFLDPRDPDSVRAIVDYHMMRGCLRTGCVRIVDRSLAARLTARTWVDEVEEAAIRGASFDAIGQLVARSGRSMAEVDAFFFARGRSVCLETEPPRCEGCSLRADCGEHTGLFQPVFRTTFY